LGKIMAETGRIDEKLVLKVLWRRNSHDIEILVKEMMKEVNCVIFVFWLKLS
jgi:hypothetical protein